MPIYRIAGDKEQLAKVDLTSFGQEGVLERSDLQRMLRDQPEVLEEGLLIIAEEFGNWDESNRRIDLLALDADGRLVVIELKRGDGAHMDLQAIRYAAMVANMTSQDVIGAYQAYLEKRANEQGKAVEEDTAESGISEHLGERETIDTEIPRILLASESFSKELTTCVMWLNNSWLSREDSGGYAIKCIRLQPYKNGSEILIEASVVIPLPEADQYQVQLIRREQEKRSDRAGKTRTIEGADAFRESIERAPEKFRPGLERLYNFAIEMQQEDVVSLETYISGSGVNFSLNLKGKDHQLVRFNNLLWSGKERGGEITFLPQEATSALSSMRRIDELIGEAKSNSGIRHRRLSRIKTSDLDEILDAIRDAYCEASGFSTADSAKEN